ncbi:hypothetical protein [Allokutzneria albata]|uniref:Uncharacterized protein n=1 Tax=Allokutzneria albata TaxID=211114 RepID=A0A1H0B9U0_ALLAB|nr:hypothetical protein [Allokutzneria albata]SDN42386.1 hypothetical protein SAMN04489726_6552 [Allokutzneria albata]
MRAASRAVVITLFGVLGLLAVAPVSSALPGQDLAQQPTTSAPPAGQPPATPEDGNRVTIGIIVVVLLGTVVIGRRIRKRAQSA